MKLLIGAIFIATAILSLLIYFGLNDVVLEAVNSANATANIHTFDGTYELVSFMPIILPCLFILIVGIGIVAWIRGRA